MTMDEFEKVFKKYKKAEFLAQYSVYVLGYLHCKNNKKKLSEKQFKKYKNRLLELKK